MINQPHWYNLKNELAEYIAPKLRGYQENFAQEGVAVPTWLVEDNIDTSNLSAAEMDMLKDEWLNIVGQMAKAFELVLDGQSGDPKVFTGLELFAKYYVHLWD
ncbi:hypothetical protein PRUB_a0492 [Pseudoalteromonas rubra]|uniref:Uncharacterized protein n=1 Tax=Pseudoalteromonas rubra TaxID=43658 RepID=A0A8T0C5T5_9GAMM|nr:hypothetical protein [Pseudoalteromonas rubra]KAF7786049.1 hypothetical protein PRUB_a0492 [Pseudoalteromonas rubra]